MRYFPTNAETPRSQHPKQEHIDLELDKDYIVQVEEPIAVEEILGENDLGPWHYVKENFKFKSKNGLTLFNVNCIFLPQK